MDNKLRFDGKVVVITGAGAGLGKSYAILFALRGAKVVINDLGSERNGDGSNTKVADAVVAEIKQSGGDAVANYDNVLNGEKIVQTAIETYGKIDILINNAGILRDKSFVRMCEDDWDVIHNVHVKGAVKTTQAAWPYFKKQKFGKVIFTSSNSGLYGNFGQANYSSAKMALVGLVNTLAIEGQSSGIHSNIIVPTAGSRLTEDIVPPDFFNELKPELIAPVVMWLCHEKCTENGSIIESALGWAGKCHLIRSNGCVLRNNNNELVTPEMVQENWLKITDMTNAKNFGSISEATTELINIMQTLSENKNPTYSFIHKYTSRDVILYAISVGANVRNPNDYHYLYENHEDFSVLPTYGVIYGPWTTMVTDIATKEFPKDFNFANILHGEQYFKVCNNIPIEATVETKIQMEAILDKKKHMIILLKHQTFNVDNGNKIFEGQMSCLIKGGGNFGGIKNSELEIPLLSKPNRHPDKSIIQVVQINQAALYRLSSFDLNPLHIDQMFAQISGYNFPILHGLCTLGFATRHVLEAFACSDAKLFDAVKARFSKAVIPGQTLKTNMWREGNRIFFETIVLETGDAVITGAYIDLKKVRLSSETSKL